MCFTGSGFGSQSVDSFNRSYQTQKREDLLFRSILAAASGMSRSHRHNLGFSWCKGLYPGFELIATLLWNIWKSCNRFFFRHQTLAPSYVIAEAQSQAHTAVISSTSVDRPLLDLDSLWRPPDPGILKMNVDGAFKPGSDQGSVAFICRDHKGYIVEGITKTVLASSTLQVEAQALFFTLNHLINSNRTSNPIIIESDCLVLVEAVKDPHLSPWEVRPFIAKAAVLLPRLIKSRIRFCRRTTNAAADWTTKAHDNGLLMPSWASFPPSPLLDILAFDVFHPGCNATFI